ncbi:DUF5304 family protein [Streptomyces sp. B1866]|uniref:DUF5304 family protein n=1 Tax=Streptomyces sp. B1866 TaxID=3075431 RepID=UPI00288E45BD|nr:DUF5304 family protein [Streptomyces sp. B1866]MDT3399044.1 DUF5304 family protein [Streptomyces sp. B1866]
MSDATERPAGQRADGGPAPEADEPDAWEPDAWERACAEDLAAERARRAAGGERTPPGSPAEELRRLAEALAEKVAGAGAPLAGPAVRGAVQQLIAQARAAVEPVVERNPDVFQHLASAGSELLAAYRAAVRDQERRWTQGDEAGKRSSSEHIDVD